MSYNSYRGRGSAPIPMARGGRGGGGRGYGQPSGNAQYYPIPPTGIPPAPPPENPRRRPPGGQENWRYADYEATPMMRYPPSTPGGGFERDPDIDYSAMSPSPPRSAPAPPPTNQHPRGMSMGRGSGSGMHQDREGGSNSDAPRPVASIAPTSPFSNDCEIIVLQKAQQQYGEMVEHLLKAEGLSVDLMFPKPDVNITDFLTPIAKKGLIFAVIIGPENEQARDINFYQFRGLKKPQLNKHVPLNMAAGLLKRKYNELQEMEIGRIPECTKLLLSRMINGELLKDTEYNEITECVRIRKFKQNMFKNRTTNVISEPKGEAEMLADTAEARELRKRILAIMENGIPNPNNNESAKAPRVSD